MTRNEFIRRFPSSSEETIRLNVRELVVGLQTEKPQSIRQRENEVVRMETQSQSHQFRVVFTVYRRKLLDAHDNARMALKPLADHIARMLGLKDDRKIEWHYAQVKSPTEGTHVLITLLD